MKLVPLLTLRADAAVPIVVGTGPYGHRIVSLVRGGTFEGPRLRGKVLPGGGDWIVVDAEGVWHLDVRLMLETEDRATIYMQYHGVVVVTDQVNAALSSGGTIDYGDTYFMTQPRFETGDERYRWLNRMVTVGEGRLESGMVEYRIYELVNG